MTPAHREILQEFQDFTLAASPQRPHSSREGALRRSATNGKVLVVQDVSADPRYLADSSLVKSEIVVPIFVNKKLTAELDIESYFADTFTPPEQQFSESCAQVLATYMANS